MVLWRSVTLLPVRLSSDNLLPSQSAPACTQQLTSADSQSSERTFKRCSAEVCCTCTHLCCVSGILREGVQCNVRGASCGLPPVAFCAILGP